MGNFDRRANLITFKNIYLHIFINNELFDIVYFVFYIRLNIFSKANEQNQTQKFIF